MEKFNRDLSDFNTALASGLPASPNGSGGAPRLAAPPKNSGKSTQLIVPADRAVAQAMDDALPVVKKVIGIHQCAIDKQSLRLLNGYGIAGSNFQDTGLSGYQVRVGGEWQYHDKNMCPSVQVIDQWKMPALNALAYRVVYFADDSGESDTFTYFMRKSSAGNWQLERFYRGN